MCLCVEWDDQLLVVEHVFHLWKPFGLFVPFLFIFLACVCHFYRSLLKSGMHFLGPLYALKKSEHIQEKLLFCNSRFLGKVKVFAYCILITQMLYIQ